MSRSEVKQQTASPQWSAALQIVESYADYAEARSAVDTLAEEGFPVERVSIVGSGLRLVEQVTGRLSTTRAAVEGGLSGALVGGLLGILLGVLVVDDTATVVLLVVGLAFGLIFGGVWGILVQWSSAGRRDYSSVSGIVAQRYDVVADHEVAGEAAHRLRSLRRSAPDAPLGTTS